MPAFSAKLITLALLAGLASTASAQVARFPCGTSSTGPDQAYCSSLTDVDGPINSSCIQDPVSTDYFCGYKGAKCQQDSQCDYGHCTENDTVTNGVCEGGLGDSCIKNGAGNNNLCLGNLYCLSASNAEASGTCGGTSAACDTNDGTGSTIANNDACVSGACDAATLQCKAPVATTTQPAHGINASQRARSRRHLIARRSQTCPPNFDACQTSQGGYECIDITANLENCGGCAGLAGMDCTTLPGVQSVECAASRCIIKSCAPGFQYSVRSDSCILSSYSNHFGDEDDE